MGKGVGFFKKYLSEDEEILIILDCTKESEYHIPVPKSLQGMFIPRFSVAFTNRGFHIASKTFETLNYQGTLYYNEINFFRFSIEDRSFTITHSNYSTSKFENAEVKAKLKLTSIKEAFEYVEKTYEA
ncbi:MAG: hypothetical protein RR539_08130 [Clostridium sp.]|uniref:hypothetical protein n=1 Tax=Clostridium sp. TaxID=1506 RepID=UPI002FC825A1